MNALKVYNTLSRKKEVFEPLNPPFVGMYVCGPTVYGEPHLGHARAAITFDVAFRYLKHLGYKVRYVRNITDVGHLEHDADEGEDKIAKKAKLEKLEPMEVVKYYTDSYHAALEKLNTLPPSIEPSASGHIPEQIKMTEEILKHGFAYKADGSVYFDVESYAKKENYGELSGRVLDDLVAGTRELDGQHGKRSSLDFALWKKASPEHIMRWESPWGEGFPGWHLECSAMSAKYLGKKFDIHGGGLDLMFPHHECEIAQSKAANGTEPAKYWLHNNMVTINGQKMSKSLGNFITMNQLFAGDHPTLQKAYSPMTIRFFVLQAHYRSTLDFSNEALLSASKGYKKLINALRILKGITLEAAAENSDTKVENEINAAMAGAYEGLNDDFNTAIAVSHLFALSKIINSINTGAITGATISQSLFDHLKNNFVLIIEQILGLTEEYPEDYETLLSGLLEIYKDAKTNKQYDKVDEIRTYFKNAGLMIKDMKNKIDWAYEE